MRGSLDLLLSKILCILKFHGFAICFSMLYTPILIKYARVQLCFCEQPILSNLFYVFFKCRKGDYNRYLAEFKSGQEREEAADQSMKAYEVSSILFYSMKPLYFVSTSFSLSVFSFNIPISSQIK